MSIELLEVNAPSYFASALINGDRSGLTDQDERELDAWLTTLTRFNPGLGSCVNCSEESFFGQWSFPEQGYLGCDLAEYTFHVHSN